MIEAALIFALVVLSLALLGSLYRVLKGPSMPDRIIALDTIGIHLISIVTIVSIMLSTEAYMELVLLIGIVAFLGTVAFSKFLERGVVIEHDRDDSNDR